MINTFRNMFGLKVSNSAKLNIIYIFHSSTIFNFTIIKEIVVIILINRQYKIRITIYNQVISQESNSITITNYYILYFSVKLICIKTNSIQ